MIESSILLVIALFLPLVNASLANLFGSYKNLRDIIGIITGTILCIVVYILARRYYLGESIDIKLFKLLPNINIAFRIEALGIIYASVASLLWVVTVIYSTGYLRKLNDQKQTRFFIWLSLSIFAALGIAFSANLLTMFILYEALTLLTLPLVAHKADFKAVSAGRKYLIYLVGTSVALFLPAIIMVFQLSGSTDFTDGGILPPGTSAITQILLLLAFLYGIGKSAVMPLHRWLPAAMVAPTPVSALLHAVAVVNAGIFCFIKIVIYIFGNEHLDFGTTQYVAYIASFTIITASLIALRQTNIKAILAYSTIAQLSYAILAVSITSPLALNAAALQIAAHASAKITLFFVVGVLIIFAGIHKVSEVNGIGRKMPFMMICFFLCSLSVAGVPYSAGNEVKEMMLAGAKAAGVNWVFYVVYASMILNLLYFLPITIRAFFMKPATSLSAGFSWTTSLAVFITTALTLGFSYYSGIILEFTKRL